MRLGIWMNGHLVRKIARGANAVVRSSVIRDETERRSELREGRLEIREIRIIPSLD